MRSGRLRQFSPFLFYALGVPILLAVISLPPAVRAGDSNQERSTAVERGKKLALENCQACHQYVGTEQAGTVGPPLVAMKSRFPERKKLYSIIYDPQQALSEHTMMPPFGRNELLDNDEIEHVIEFLYTL